jgi:hypothetical protein
VLLKFIESKFCSLLDKLPKILLYEDSLNSLKKENPLCLDSLKGEISFSFSFSLEISLEKVSLKGLLYPNESLSSSMLKSFGILFFSFGSRYLNGAVLVLLSTSWYSSRNFLNLTS